MLLHSTVHGTGGVGGRYVSEGEERRRNGAGGELLYWIVPRPEKTVLVNNSNWNMIPGTGGQPFY